ncbi:SpoIIE family protein phosphatase [Puerhibacterium puerhi]|uniref:SpoIIE family protein phosphatase n=1 Tax=Puerhibacterium puerhi TaxID=2692623 RepID=UPI00135BEBC5|nr:SpoIIE family protein phosphatase [Puerhibacterium puerhi]
MAPDVQAARQPRPGLSAADEAFDRVARLVHRHLGVPAAFVSVLAPGGTVLPGALGLAADVQAARRTEVPQPLTRRVIDSGPLVLPDTAGDADAPSVTGLVECPVAAVAAYPLHGAGTGAVGALFAVDDRPRAWTDADLATLADLAATCSGEIRLRTERERAQAAERAARRAQRRSQLLLSLSEAFADAISAAQVEERIGEILRTGAGARWSSLALVDGDRRRIAYVSPGPQDPYLSASMAPARIDDPRPLAQVVRTARPLYFRDHAELAAAFPTVAPQVSTGGAWSLLPVVARGLVVGVIVTGWDDEREQDPDTAALETTLAQYVAHALDRVALLEERRHVATTLQEALLTAPPAVPHLDIASTYVPATRTDQVGGDWYDAVAIDEDTTVLMIGDVTGHDMAAAAQMGQLRSMLRALAWSHDELPSALLTLLDRANHRLGPGAGASAVVVRLERLPARGEHAETAAEPGSYVVTWSNAGHPPPLVLRRDGSVERLDARPDLLLGVAPATERHDHTATLGPGETLLLYTDGLVERRGLLLADRIAELARALAATRGAPTSTLPPTLVRRLVTGPQRDDVAVLAVRARVTAPAGVQPSVGPVRAVRQVAPHLDDLGPARRWVDDVLETSGVGARERHTAVLLTSELVTNALEHGAPPVTVTVEVTCAALRIAVRDGSGALPVVRHPAPTELSGRGVQFLARLSARWGVEVHDGVGAPGADGARRAGDDVARGTGENGVGGDAVAPPGKTVWFELDTAPAPVGAEA